MKMQMEKFGKMLISRPSGREAFAAAKAYVLPDQNGKDIELDFLGVDVLSPSWLDEFVTGLRQSFPGIKIAYLNTDNQSVKATLEILAKNA